MKFQGLLELVCRYLVILSRHPWCIIQSYSQNWMAPWKNRISSTTMKLRKSLVKPVTWWNISSCLVLPPEIVMHDALMLFSELLPIYASSCMTISGERTEQLDIIAGFLPRQTLQVIFVRRKRPPMRHPWRSRVQEPNNTLFGSNRFWRAGCSRLEYVDIHLVY